MRYGQSQWTGLAVGALLIIAVATAQADTVTLGAVTDATLYESTSPGTATSNGAGSYFFAGRNNDTELRRSVIRFPISENIPNLSTINSVTLTLHMSRTRVGEQSVALHRAMASWTEGPGDPQDNEGIGDHTIYDDDVTWWHRSRPDVLWSVEGGDFAVFASATAAVDQFDFYSWSSPGMVADVQNWLADPASNYGWFVIGNEFGERSTKRFDSRENGNIEFRPQLVVDFNPGGVATQPATWSGMKALYR